MKTNPTAETTAGRAQGHKSVLASEVVAVMQPQRGGLRLLDCTFGWGGHTRSLLNAAADNTVIALDCDPEAIGRAKDFEQEFGSRFTFHPGNFEHLDRYTTEPLDGILFDFGLASSHYDCAERGFSFRQDGPVDMRLNTDSGMTAADFLETGEEQDLVTAIRNYGEEQRWRAVVRTIMAARGTGKLQRTATLAELVAQAVTAGRWQPGRIHPATRSFQGIRIFINRELEVIETALPKAFAQLKSGGILAAISFHSLEDRIVKRYFRHLAGQPEHAADNRAQQERLVQATLLTRRPLIPDAAETEVNPRARSAKLRAVQKGAN